MSYIGSRKGLHATADPSLPRFGLPLDHSADPSDVAKTTERPALAPGRARRIVRKRTIPPPPPSADEVAPEDILLEAYLEPVPVEPPTERMLDAIDRQVDELLRATGAQASEQDTPSVAPVALEREHVPPSFGAPSMPPLPAAAAASAPPRRGLLTGLGPILLVGIGVAAGAALVLVVPPGAVARAKAAAHGLVTRARSVEPPPAPIAAPSSSDAPAPEAPAIAEAPPPAPTFEVVPVDALPSPAIARGVTRVTFPPYAAGHRIYVDGAVLTSGDGQAEIRCGRRTVQIGSAGKPRELDLPCGAELTLP